MSFILPKVLQFQIRQLLPVFLLAASIHFTQACAYRFSNTAMQAPLGIRTIAIEAVYDTSREVIPHELLWSAVQREFAKRGQLIVSSQEQADALMTIWLVKAKVQPTGTPSREAISKDPPVTDTEKWRPEDFRNLRRAGSWTTSEMVGLGLVIEVHDLKTRKVLFKKSYNQSTTFSSLRPENISSVSSSFLHYEEALRSKVKLLSEQLAQVIVTDFFALGPTNSGH